MAAQTDIQVPTAGGEEATPSRRRRVQQVPARVVHRAHDDVVGAAILLGATILALVLANSPMSEGVEHLLHADVGLDFGGLHLTHSLHHWVNDALMAVFFFVVGLEIKQEITTGDLSSPRNAALPVIGALGGMVVPAVLFLAWNGGGDAASGWGIPMATDIAFAVAVLAVFGRGLPSGLRTFLLALAVADDLGAILVIAAFYTETIDTGWLTVAVLGLGVVVAMRRVGIARHAAYVPVALLVWYATFESGIHATIAGVALGLLTPALVPHGQESPAAQLRHRIHPWTVLVVLPLFALSNAGVELSPSSVGEAMVSPVALGVITGLVVGKAVGIVAFTKLAVRSKVGALPEGVDNLQLLGVALVAGIGFTVSLFVTGLAYEDVETVAAAKTGIVVASVLAAAVGGRLLRSAAVRVERSEVRWDS